MSRHKSQVLTVKIQLKVKFPQAVITKIRTLRPVFRKMFRTAVWRKTRDSCFWNHVCKTNNLCSMKVFTEMCFTSFFMEIKMLTEKILFKEICASLQQIISIDKKPSFLLKNIYLYDLWYLSSLKTREVKCFTLNKK